MREFTIEEAREYTQKQGKSIRFYVNFYGWNRYYTLKPTFATPTGRLKEFPNSILISYKNGAVQPIVNY